MRKKLSSRQIYFSLGTGAGESDRFLQSSITKNATEGTRGKKLYYSKIDSLLLPDSFCVEGESAAGNPRLDTETSEEEGHNERSGEGRERRVLSPE